MTNKKRGLSRRQMALVWMTLIGIVIGVLIAYEQISVLYFVTTIALILLLLVVAFADLESVGLVDSEDNTRRF